MPRGGQAGMRWVCAASVLVDVPRGGQAVPRGGQAGMRWGCAASVAEMGLERGGGTCVSEGKAEMGR